MKKKPNKKIEEGELYQNQRNKPMGVEIDCLNHTLSHSCHFSYHSAKLSAKLINQVEQTDSYETKNK